MFSGSGRISYGTRYLIFAGPRVGEWGVVCVLCVFCSDFPEMCGNLRTVPKGSFSDSQSLCPS